MKGHLAIVLLSATLLRAEASGPTSADIKSLRTSEKGVVIAELENGLVVLLKEVHTAPLVDVRVIVKTGSMYEGEYLGAGISHLFEHLIHGGPTSTRSEADTEKLLRSLGGASNAFTSHDDTTFYITTTASNFATAVELLADWMQHCTITEKEFQRERGVILREMERSEDDPASVLYKLTWLNVFLEHPVRHPVIGYRSIFEKLTLADVNKYYRTRYVPNNMVFTAVGDFAWKKALEKIQQAFAGFERRALPAVPLPAEPAQITPRFVEQETPFKATYVTLSYRTVPLSHPDLYPLDLAAYILSEGDSSRLVRRLKYELALVDGIGSSSYTPPYDAGLFIVNAEMKPENKEKALAAIRQEIDRLKREKVPAAELERAKAQKRAELFFGLKTVASQASSISNDYVTTGDPDFSYKYVERLQKVTAGEIREAARRYFGDRNCTVVVLTPKSKAAAPKETAAETTEIVKDSLPNGLTILLRRDNSIPLVAMQAYFLGGVRLEDENNVGITNLMAEMLLRGTRHYSAQQIAVAFDSVGGSINASAGNNTFFVTAEVPSEHFQKTFKVFADVVLEPSFPASELETVRELVLNGIKQRSDNPHAEAEVLFRQTIFKTSPYRKDYLGTEETVKKFTSKDLKAFWERCTASNRGVIAVFGDIPLDETRALLRRTFGRMRPARTEAAPPAEPPFTEPRIALKKMEKTNAIVQLGFLGPVYRSIEDRAALEVLDAVISGVDYPSGWLHDRLRGKQLVYEVHAYPFTGLESGYFAAVAVTTPDKVRDVIAEFQTAFQQCRDGKITEEELQLAKDICLTMDRIHKQTNSALASQAALDELYTGDYRATARLEAAIRATTVERLRALAQQYFTGYALSVVSPRPELAGVQASP